MSDCEKYQEMLSCLLDGELTAEESEGLRRHLDSCAECKALYEAFTALQNTLESDMEEPPKALAEGVMFRIQNEAGSRKKPVNKVLLRTLAAAACFAVVLFAAVKAELFSGMKGATEAPAVAEDAMDYVECCEAPAECVTDAMPNDPAAPQEMPDKAKAASDSIAAYGFAGFPVAGEDTFRNESTEIGTVCDGGVAEEKSDFSEPILYIGETYAYAGALNSLPDGAAVLDGKGELTIPAIYCIDPARETYILNDALYVPDESGAWYVFRK